MICQKRNHFAAVCRSKPAAAVHDLTAYDDDEVLMTLSNGGKRTDRVYSTLLVNGRCVRFLLDCGSTVNLLPASISKTITTMKLQPARSTLRMFDKTKVKTLGMISATVHHPLTQAEHQLDFYVTPREDLILGIDACQRLDYCALWRKIFAQYMTRRRLLLRLRLRRRRRDRH